MNMIRNASIIVALAGAAAALQPASAQKSVEASGPYRHSAAAADFPVRVGEFRRADVYEYDDKGRDVSASYNLVTPEGRMLITVYIYPAAAEGDRTEQCSREFGNVKGAIQEQHGVAAPAEEGPAIAVPGTNRDRGRRAVYRLNLRFDGEVRAVRSEAHLYCHVGGDWFVKYRVSAPVAVTAPGAVETFIRTGPWPGRSSAEAVARLEPRRGRGTPLPTQR
ncbi:MAG TPA: hypothetical protein VD846_05240 [Allosphingosinicella sp.]|nr:hypothetical protein [Allosphingosinicella sp.]